jgi:retinol dehydrogenase 12
VKPWIDMLIPILVVPFGRIKDIREDLLAATKTEAEGGSGIGLKFWEWNEEQIKEHIKD